MYSPSRLLGVEVVGITEKNSKHQNFTRDAALLIAAAKPSRSLLLISMGDRQVMGCIMDCTYVSYTPAGLPRVVCAVVAVLNC